MEKVEYFGAVHGVTLRAIAAFSDDDLDFRPQPAMRTVRELIFHIYTQEQIVAEAVQLGSLTSEAMRLSSPESDGVAVKVEALATVSDLKAYAPYSRGIPSRTPR